MENDHWEEMVGAAYSVADENEVTFRDGVRATFAEDGYEILHDRLQMAVRNHLVERWQDKRLRADITFKGTDFWAWTERLTANFVAYMDSDGVFEIEDNPALYRHADYRHVSVAVPLRGVIQTRSDEK